MTSGRHLFLPALLAMAMLLISCAQEETTDLRGTVIRVKLDTLGAEADIAPQLVADFQRETGIEVSILDGPSNVSEWLLQSRMLLGSRSSSVDVYQIDVIWTGMLGEHFVDLSHLIEHDRADFYEAIIENNTVGGRLVAIPWFSDAGLLYYRRDLIEKYGFDGPPETWDELEEMALAIQEGEREAGNEDFWGYVWHIEAQENLTSTALELQASHGGGTLLNYRGEVEVDNAETVAAFTRARDWIDTITPSSLIDREHRHARETFVAGNAAFLRDWSAFHRAVLGPDSAVRSVAAEAPLPGGEGGRAATLGGWQLGVSRYSNNREAAEKFVEWMTSPSTMERRAREGGFVPPRRSVTEQLSRDQQRWTEVIAPTMENVVARPSRQSGHMYNDVSTLYYRTVNRILRGDADPEDALDEMAATMRLWGIEGRARSASNPSRE